MSLNLPLTLKKIGVGILDTLFPIFCLGCGAYGDFLCAHCLSALPRRLRQRCPTCLKVTTPRGETCFACSGKSFLDGLYCPSYYKDPLVALSIHTYKYRFIPQMAEPLGLWLGERLMEINLPLPDLSIPVPLHPRRLRFRGFNQSALLADALSRMLTPGNVIPTVHHTLVRIRYTKPQMKTRSREERLANLKNAFAVNTSRRAAIRGKNIWLIDDVATTGTTLEECARTLKKSGARSVFGIVLAR